jgi:putative MATE family efflux protein
MKDLTRGNEGMALLLFMVPLLIGNVFQQLYIIIDSVVVGQFLGKQALAAIGACFPIIFLLIALIMGLTMGASVVISQYYGAKKFDMVHKTIDTAYITLFSLAAVMSVTGPFFSTWILNTMHTPVDIFPLAKTFIDIFFYGLVLTFGYNSVGSVLRAMGDSKTPTFYLILATIVNSVLVLLFVLVFHWGIAGSALATLIAQGCSFFGLIWHVNRKENKLLHFKPHHMVFDWSIFKRIVFIGMPAGVQQLSVALGMMAITRLVNGFGTDAIAGFTAASRLDSFALMPSMNLSLAVSTFVAQNIGANKLERVKKGLLAGLGMTTVFSLFITAVILLFGAHILTIFTHDQSVLGFGDRYFHIAGSFYIVFGLMFVLTGLFRGAGDTVMPMIMTILAMWVVRVPVAVWLSRHIGTDGIWWSFVIGWMVGLTLSTVYYLTGIWKRFKVVLTQQPL